MARPFTRDQTLQNRAFLTILRRTGNIRLAARQIGLAPATLHGRRHANEAFAQRWDAAIVAAHAHLAKAGGCRSPAVPAATDPASTAAAPGFRTRGGEVVVVRRRDGRCQVRRAQPGKLTREAELAFLAALSATANIRLSAAATGAAEAAFHRKRRRHPGFAREWQLALAMGYDRIEAALLESYTLDAHEHDAWRHNEPPPIPQMTANQALQLLYLHQKEARLIAEPAHIKRRHGESREARSARLAAIYEAGQQRRRDEWLIAEHARRARGEPWLMGPKELPPLPALDQVEGWSKADVTKAVYHQGIALFGGWRLDDMKSS